MLLWIVTGVVAGLGLLIAWSILGWTLFARKMQQPAWGWGKAFGVAVLVFLVAATPVTGVATVRLAEAANLRAVMKDYDAWAKDNIQGQAQAIPIQNPRAVFLAKGKDGQTRTQIKLGNEWFQVFGPVCADGTPRDVEKNECIALPSATTPTLAAP